MNIGKALVLSGEGLNTEVEMAHGFQSAGLRADIVHVRDVLSGKIILEDYHVLAIPGGFSYGDDLGSAKVLANQFQTSKIDGKMFLDHVVSFVEAGNLIMGVCNGFQCLVKLGLLPACDKKYGHQTATLTFNTSDKFEMRWVTLKINPSPCPAFEGIKFIELPVRHGEGRFVTHASYGLVPQNQGEKTLQLIHKNKQIFAQYVHPNTIQPAMEYPFNPNGSIDAVAGVCDPSGRIFGLMPHPEGHIFFENHPLWHRRKVFGETRREGDGMKVFRNIARYIEEDIL